LRVTWRHRSRNHLIAHMPFPIGSLLLWNGVYLQPFGAYWSHEFDLTRSYDVIGHVTIWKPMPFPIGGPLERSVSKCSRFRDCALSVFWSRVWPYKVTWRHRSRDHLIADYVISYWWSFGTILPLSLTVSEIFNVECNAMVDNDLDTTSKQRSRSFMLIPSDFSYTTSYRLPIVTFALGRTV